MNNNNYTDEQKIIIEQSVLSEHHIVVNATAGSGKSHTVNGIIDNFAKYKGKNMLVTTFGKDIAKDFKSDRVQNVTANNIHSFMYNVWGKKYHGSLSHNFMSGSDEKHYLKRLGFDETTIEIIKFLKYFAVNPTDSKRENDVEFLINTYFDVLYLKEIPAIKKYFEKLLTNPDYVSFDDLIYLPVVQNIELPKFNIVLADETQDLDLCTKMLLVRLLAKNAKMIFLGDPDQAIMGFRGADQKSMSYFRPENGFEEYQLSTSFRVPSKIVNFVKKATMLGKNMVAHQQGGLITESSLAEIRKGDMVLARNNHTINRLKQYFGSKKMDFICSNEAYGKKPENKENFVYISTIHAAKGMESDRVFIVGDDDIINYKNTETFQFEQDERLRFVAYTRAKKSLHFVNDSFDKKMNTNTLFNVFKNYKEYEK